MADLGQALGFTSAAIEPAAAVSRLSAALICGGLIGFDREVHDRPAGLRTHMLVALAASLFTLLTFETLADAAAFGDAARADPVRIVEALTAGVAFLAAGTIIVSQGGVRGLTTGASLWLAGATGLATGLGLYWIAYLATGAALLVLIVMQAVKSLTAGARDALKHDKNATPSDQP
jgi:putative Mg2+ transporter-C (MgtC) family protein